MKKYIPYLIFFIVSCSTMVLHSQTFKLQVGIEMAKYIRNWSYVKQVPLEIVAMGYHDKKLRLYPRLSIGTGSFEKPINNCTGAVNGIYAKPGVDFYYGRRGKPVAGILGLNLIFGRYNYTNTVRIYNPVWGDLIETTSAQNQMMNGLEFNYGLAIKIKSNFEFKFLTGVRGKLAPNSFSENAKGIIPGYGRTVGNYTATPFGAIIFSYRLD